MSLYAKRLERGRFLWPSPADGCVSISASQLGYMLDGIDLTIENKTGIANLVIWPLLFEKQRRVILSASMLAIGGRLQREGEVVHIAANRLHDLSDALASLRG